VSDRSNLGLSVVVPVYRSESGLPQLFERLTQALDRLGRSWEVILVDDFSPDRSWDVMRRLKGDDPRFVLVQLTRNHGQQRAVMCGLAHAQGKYVVTMDDDLQHDPGDIAVLLEALETRDCDAVIARFETKQHGIVRNLGTWAVKRIAKHTVGVPLQLDLTSFRVMRKETARALSEQRNPNPVVGFLLHAVTRRIENVTVRHHPRALGRSSYGLRHLVVYMTQMVLDYSDFPLRMVGYLGFWLALGSFGLGSFYFVRYAQGMIMLTGWTTLVLLICLLSGLLLMSMGVIGVYLVRILRSINTMQMFLVRRVER